MGDKIIQRTDALYHAHKLRADARRRARLHPARAC